MNNEETQTTTMEQAKHWACEHSDCLKISVSLAVGLAIGFKLGVRASGSVIDEILRRC